MSKQVLPVGGQQRSLLGRVVMFVIVIGVIGWFIKSPIEASTGVKTMWGWLMGAGDAIETFLDALAG